ncbi:MAG TPA: rod shape-determining protein MreC [Acidimicrobiia bacterium]|nr:rod shape-determining protein MreC [Acidimicrobiia bacterium]
MVVYRRSQRRSVLVLLVLTSITLVTLDLRGDGGGIVGSVRQAARDAFAPVQGAADAVFSPVGNFIDGIARSGTLKSENSALRRRLQEVEGDLARVRGLDRENRVLRDLLELDYAKEIDGVVGRVVGLAPGNFEWSITIDRGSEHGVKEEMPVVSGEGLVGRVVDVSQTRSKVLLLTDPRMSVGVRLAGSGETGVTRGLAGKDVLEVDLVDPDVPTEKNELVVTSGLQQSRYPPGLPVGTVASVSSRPGSLEKDLRVLPLADLERLEFVKILLWEPDRTEFDPVDAPIEGGTQ